MFNKKITLLISALLFGFSPFAYASIANLNLTHNPLSITALIIFCIAYLIVFFEEYTHIRKSKPMILRRNPLMQIY
jgi:hypothetical protein